MSIQVNDFQWKPGENDAEYIRLLKRSNEECHELLLKATGKLVKMAHAGMIEWISVNDRLPKPNESIMLCAFGKSVGEGTYQGHDGYHNVWKMYAVCGTYWDDEITHWMPLPEPPKEG